MSLLRLHYGINSGSSSQVGKATGEVVKLKPRLRGFTSVNTEMANGTSWLTHMWSGTVYQALLVMKHPETLHYQVNKEGVPVGSDTLMIPKNAPHPNTALLFLDYMLRPESSAANTKAIGYPMQCEHAARQASRHHQLDMRRVRGDVRAERKAGGGDRIVAGLSRADANSRIEIAAAVIVLRDQEGSS